MALTRRWLLMIQLGSPVLTVCCYWRLCSDLWGNAWFISYWVLLYWRASHCWWDFADLSSGSWWRKVEAWIGDGDCINWPCLGRHVAPVLNVSYMAGLYSCDRKQNFLGESWHDHPGSLKVCLPRYSLNMKRSSSDLKINQKDHISDYGNLTCPCLIR